jgi:hypothetical protein
MEGRSLLVDPDLELLFAELVVEIRVSRSGRPADLGEHLLGQFDQAFVVVALNPDGDRSTPWRAGPNFDHLQSSGSDDVVVEAAHFRD